MSSENIYTQLYDNDEFYRPPREEHSAFLEIAYGCSWAGCTFCDFIKDEYKVYSLKDVAYNGQEITGTLAHDPTTAAAEQVSVRVTFFVTGNYYMATVAEVEPDGSFAVEGVGPIEYITLLASGSEGTLTAADLVID